MAGSTIYWVGFNLVKGIGAARIRLMLDYFGDLEKAWSAPASSLISAGLNPKLVEGISQIRTSDKLAYVWEYIQKNGITVLTWENPEYPRRLKEIDQPPPVLYVRGELLEEDQWAVAIVGTRRITPYGRLVSESVVSALANSGITIVSGLARGVDHEAHLSALRSGGRTIAVLGSGVDRIYPSEHHKTAEQILSHGALVSDYPPGTAPDAANFPPRNRIISGLSQAVIVVEAGEKSGALITAAFAAEQGREVFAVPGNINALQSKGTNLLIREGAHILLDAQTVLEILNYTQVSQQRTARSVLPADATEAELYGLLSHEPLYIDEITTQTSFSVEKVSAALTMMELKGMVKQVGNMRYIAIYEPRSEYQVDEC